MPRVEIKQPRTVTELPPARQSWNVTVGYENGHLHVGADPEVSARQKDADTARLEEIRLQPQIAGLATQQRVLVMPRFHVTKGDLDTLGTDNGADKPTSAEEDDLYLKRLVILGILGKSGAHTDTENKALSARFTEALAGFHGVIPLGDILRVRGDQGQTIRLVLNNTSGLQQRLQTKVDHLGLSVKATEGSNTQNGNTFYGDDLSRLVIVIKKRGNRQTFMVGMINSTEDIPQLEQAVDGLAILKNSDEARVLSERIDKYYFRTPLTRDIHIGGGEMPYPGTNLFKITDPHATDVVEKLDNSDQPTGSIGIVLAGTT